MKWDPIVPVLCVLVMLPFAVTPLYGLVKGYMREIFPRR